MSRPVLLLPHDPAWPRLASQEAARITLLLGQQLIAIHHIGSTAIPGIRAKPILDLLGEVRRIEFFDERPDLLHPLDYRARSEMGIPGRRYFSKSASGPRTHHLHLYQSGDPNIHRHLLFRDYLLAHPGAAAEYERLKLALAAQFPDDTTAYTEAKSLFIQAAEQAADRWRVTIGPWPAALAGSPFSAFLSPQGVTDGESH